MSKKSWNFTIVGCDGPSADCPHYLAFYQTKEEARSKIKAFEAIGWRRVVVFDAFLKEVQSDQ